MEASAYGLNYPNIEWFKNTVLTVENGQIDRFWIFKQVRSWAKIADFVWKFGLFSTGNTFGRLLRRACCW